MNSEASDGPTHPRTYDTNFEDWIGRAVVDPSGIRIGKVTQVTRDGLDGAWLSVLAERGALVLLPAIGGGSVPSFTFHSRDVDEREGLELFLKRCLRPPESPAKP